MRRLLVLPALAIALVLLPPETAEVKEHLIDQVELDFYLENPIMESIHYGDVNVWKEFTSVAGFERGKAWHFRETWAVKDGETGPVLLPRHI